MRTPYLCAAAALALAACAPVPQAAPAGQQAAARQCFHVGRVNGFREARDEQVDLIVGAGDVYRVELFGVCPDIDWSTRIAVRGRGGGSYVCGGQDLEFIVPSTTSRSAQVCLARSVRRLTPEEAAAPRAR